MQNFDHRHVVKYYEYAESTVMTKENGEKVQVACIAQEMVEGGELYDYLAYCGPFSGTEARYFFRQLLEGVHYIHSNGLSHRDLNT